MSAWPETPREYPEFGLCGLNCGLCPRHRTEGPSQCPGCGAPGFRDKHPTCAVMTCARRHGVVDFCFRCADYPCARHERAGESDSFITYRRLLADLETARTRGLESYIPGLRRRMAILDSLLARCDDGRHKGYFCLAANLLPLGDLEEVMATLAEGIAADVAAHAVRLLDGKAALRDIELKLRKAPR